MIPKFQAIALMSLCLWSMDSFGQAVSEPRRPSSGNNSGRNAEIPVFGPYEAIAINRGVVNDVKVDKELNIYLQLFPEHKNKELIVKISNERFSSYREWVHGGLELVSPANAGKTSYGWTDWVQTKAKYIEYWMDGEIFLHLKRADF